MIMSRKLARRRMLMWYQRQSDSVETKSVYVFTEGDSDVSAGYIKTINQTTFEDGTIKLKPVYLSTTKRWDDSSIKISGADFSKYNKLCIDCYCDWAVTYVDNSALVGYGNSNGFINSSEATRSRKIVEFDLTNMTESENGEHYIMAKYDREDNCDDEESYLIIYNIWFEEASDGSGETEEPETPVQETFAVTLEGDNFTFDGKYGEDAATKGELYTATITAASGEYIIKSVVATIDDNAVGSCSAADEVWMLEIPGESITGNINIKIVTVQTFSVSVTGENFTFDGETGEGAATEGTDYIAMIATNEDEGYKIESITVTVGGNEIDSYTFADGVLTIPGADITGDIVINIVTTKEETVEPEKLYIFEYEDTSLKPGFELSGENYESTFTNGYLQLKGALASGCVAGISDVDFTNYETLYIEVNRSSSSNADSQIRIGYDETLSTNVYFNGGGYNHLSNADLGDYVFSFDISDISGNYAIKTTLTSANGVTLYIKNIWLEKASDTDTGEETPGEEDNSTEATEKIYIFDSARTDNFLFGRFDYSPARSSSSWVYKTDWTGGYVDNDDLGKIQLFAYGPSASRPSGYKEISTLAIRPNGLAENGYFNNRALTIGDLEYAEGEYMIPLGAYKLCVNAYCTDTGAAATVSYGTASIEVNSTETKPYKLDIELDSTTYIWLKSARGCGTFVITDIWLEKSSTVSGGAESGDDEIGSDDGEDSGGAETPEVNGDPVSYVIYEAGSDSINYGAISDNGSQCLLGDGEHGYAVNENYIEAYSGISASSSGGLIPVESTLSTAGEGSWKLVIDTTQITEPGVLYITAYGNDYTGKSAVTINGTQYYSDYEWKLSVLNSSNIELMSKIPPTGVYTYSCQIDNPEDGIVITGYASVVGTTSINLFVTKIEYVANTTLEATDDCVLFGDGVFRKGIAWEKTSTYGSVEEDNCILKLVDISSDGYPWATFLNNQEDDNGEVYNAGFDFTGYNTLNVQTERVVNEATASCYVCYNSSNTSTSDNRIYLTGHESGTYVDSIDISGVSGINYVFVKSIESVWISKVWLSK